MHASTNCSRKALTLPSRKLVICQAPIGNGQRGGQGSDRAQPQETDAWNCSGKQRDLILKIVEEHKLEKAKVEGLAQDRFGKAVKALNKLEASGLIEELLEQTGQSKGNERRRWFQRAGAR